MENLAKEKVELVQTRIIPETFFLFNIIPVTFQIMSNEEMYWKDYQSNRIMMSGRNLGGHAVQIFCRVPIFGPSKWESLFSKTFSSLSLSFLYWRAKKYRE